VAIPDNPKMWQQTPKSKFQERLYNQESQQRRFQLEKSLESIVATDNKRFNICSNSLIRERWCCPKHEGVHAFFKHLLGEILGFEIVGTDTKKIQDSRDCSNSLMRERWCSLKHEGAHAFFKHL
jgi:hypothetical protein